MKVCRECLEDFLQSPGAQSKDGKSLISLAQEMGFEFELVPPEECKDSAHPVKEEEE